ncbi:MAG: ATP-binding protein [Acidobacteriota bacterium]
MTDGRAGAGSAGQSIETRLVVGMVILMVGQLALLAGIGVFVEVVRLMARAQAQLEQAAVHALETVELRLGFVVDNVQAFAGSSFVVNSVVDATGRSHYLPEAVREMTENDYIASVTVVDFAGHPIQTSRNASSEWLKRVDLSATLGAGRAGLFVTEDGRVVTVAPIEYYDTPQGAVVVELHATTLFQDGLSSPERPCSMELDGKPVWAQGAEGEELVTFTLTAGAEQPHLHELSARLSVHEPREHARALVLEFLLQVVIAGFFALVASVFLARQLGRRLSRPIRLLAERVRRGVHPCGPVGTRDELETLASAIDHQTSALVEVHQELEAKVAERTAELAERTRKLERSNADLESFAYATSHDLRSPLRHVDGLVTLLIEEGELESNERFADHARLLRERVSRMEALIEGILAYSRAESVGELTEDVDVGSLLEEMLEQDVTVPNGFRVEVQDGLPTIRGNATFVRQVFFNLISNAVKHHDREDGLVAVGWRRREDFHEFSVVDDGPGIEARHHEKIFGLFQTLGRERNAESSGIGLALVKRILDEVGGELSLVSEPGSGARFVFTWPSARVVTRDLAAVGSELP